MKWNIYVQIQIICNELQIRSSKQCCKINDKTPPIHSVRSVRHGTVSYRYYYSENGHTSVVIYTPPDYRKNIKKYQCFFLLHGTTDTEETWTKVGRKKKYHFG